MNSIEREFSDTLLLLTDFKVKRLLVAFSGGCDSLALLSLSAKALGCNNVTACYVNHRIRTDSELLNEIELNKLNCRKLGVELVIRDLGPDSVKKAAGERKGGVEDAARFLRYKALKQTAEDFGCNFIATAHHSDDQAETVLMRLINGSPTVSLRGIPEISDCVIRPLLQYSKQEIESYISEKGLKYSTDSTNVNSDYTRNKIRNVIIPELQQIMPDWKERVLRIRDKVVSLCSGLEFKETDCVDYAWFSSLSYEHKTIVLYTMWDSVMNCQLPQKLINRVIDSEKDECISSNGGSFTVYNGKLYVTSNDNSEYKSFTHVLEDCTIPGNMRLYVSDTGNPLADVFFKDKSLSSHAFVRFASEGDAINLKDGRKMVKRLLQDMKIPPVLRNRVPVLEDNGEVKAVFGSVFGKKNRVCRSLLTSLADGGQTHYIYIIKGTK